MVLIWDSQLIYTFFVFMFCFPLSPISIKMLQSNIYLRGKFQRFVFFYTTCDKDRKWLAKSAKVFIFLKDKMNTICINLGLPGFKTFKIHSFDCTDRMLQWWNTAFFCQSVSMNLKSSQNYENTTYPAVFISNLTEWLLSEPARNMTVVI